VQPVLRLVEDDGVLGLEHLVGHLQAVHSVLLEDVLADLRLAVVERRQAVHELHRRVARPGQHGAVHLIGGECVDALGPGGLVLTHRYPHVGVEEVHAADALVHVLGQGETGAGLLGDPPAGVDEAVLRPPVTRGAQPHVHAVLAAADHQRVPHVVPGVAQVAVADLTQVLLAVLGHRQHVGQDLGRVELVGESVPHRDPGVLGKRLHRLLREPAVLDAVEGAPEHSGGVLHRLLVTDLGAAGLEVGDVRALVLRGHLERGASASRGLLEDERDLLPGEVRLLVPGVLGGLQVGSELEQEPQLLGGEVQLLEEVAVAEVEGHRRFLCSRRDGEKEVAGQPLSCAPTAGAGARA
jgi:hypothetical protein